MDTASKRVDAFRSPLDQAIAAKTGMIPAPVTMEEIGKHGLFKPSYDPVSVQQPYQKENPATEAPTETKLDREGASEYVKLLKDGTDPAQARLQALQHQQTAKAAAQNPAQEPQEQPGIGTRIMDAAGKSLGGFADVIGNVAEGTKENFVNGSRQLGADIYKTANEGIMAAPGNALSALSDVATIAGSPAAGLASAGAKEVGKAVDLIPEEDRAMIAKSAKTALPYGTEQAAEYVKSAIENMSPQQKELNKDFLNAVNVLATVSGAATAPEAAGLVGKALDSTSGNLMRGIDEFAQEAGSTLKGMKRPGFMGGKTAVAEAAPEVPVMKGGLETPVKNPVNPVEAITPEEQGIVSGLGKRTEKGIIGGQEVDIPLPTDKNIVQK